MGTVALGPWGRGGADGGVISCHVQKPETPAAQEHGTPRAGENMAYVRMQDTHWGWRDGPPRGRAGRFWFLASDTA